MKDKRKIEKLTISLIKETEGRRERRREGERKGNRREEKKKETGKERAMKNISTDCQGQAVLKSKRN